VIADGDFVDAELALGAFHDNLRLKAEAVRTDRDTLEEVRAEDLIAGFHVREVEIAEHVGNQGEALIDHGVPEGEDARLFAGKVARAEDGVGVAIQQRAEEAGILGGIVFQIGVLDQGEIAGGHLDGGADGGAFAAIVRVLREEDLRECGGEALENEIGPVGGTIVDNHQLALHVFGEFRGEDERDAPLHNGALVVDGH
jgi:hypothetical protein